MFWIAPRWRRGALRYQSSLNARSVARLARPFGKTSGKVSSCGASNFSGSLRSFAGQLVARGERPAGEHGPAELRAGGGGVEPGGGVAVGVVRAVGEQREQLVEVAGAVGVDDEVRRLGAVQLDRRRARSRRSGPCRRRWPRTARPRGRPASACGPRRPPVTRSIDSTWLPKLPLVWWFLPWTSAPIAPPIVTCRVPGSTGTHQPSGSAARIRVSRLTPPSTTATPRVGVDRGRAGEPGHVEHEAARVLRGVAVGAAEAAGDHPARARGRDRGGHVGGRAGDGDVREGRGGAPPTVQAGGRGRGAGHREPGYAPAGVARPPAGPPRRTPSGLSHGVCDRRTCWAGCTGPAACVTHGKGCDACRSSRRRPAIVGAGRYDPPDRRSTAPGGVTGERRGDIGARGVGERGGQVGGWRGAAGPQRAAAPAVRAHRGGVPGRLPRPAPPPAPAAHHRHRRLDLQRLVPVRLVDPLAAVVARARRRSALHHLPARPARRERDVEHARPGAGHPVRPGHAHGRARRGLQRRDDPRTGRVRARARPGPGGVGRALVAPRRRRVALRLLPVRDRAQLGRPPQPGVGRAAAGPAVAPARAPRRTPPARRGGPACSSGSRSPCRPASTPRPWRSAPSCSSWSR